MHDTRGSPENPAAYIACYGKPMALSSLLVYSSCYDLDHTVSCRVTFQTPICTCAGE